MHYRNLYIVAFMGLGRRVTLDVDFRYRSLSECVVDDRKILTVDMVWEKSPFEDFPALIGQWASAMLLECLTAQQQGYTLCASKITLQDVIEKLFHICELSSSGHKGREVVIGEFLTLCVAVNQST